MLRLQPKRLRYANVEHARPQPKMNIAYNFADWFDMMHPNARNYFASHTVYADLNLMQQMMMYYHEKELSSEERKSLPLSSQEYHSHLHKTRDILGKLIPQYVILDFYHNYLFTHTGNTSLVQTTQHPRVYLEVMAVYNQSIKFLSFVIA